MYKVEPCEIIGKEILPAPEATLEFTGINTAQMYMRELQETATDYSRVRLYKDGRLLFEQSI